MGYKIGGNKIYTKYKVMTMLHNHNSDDVFAINVRRANDIDDSSTDYHAGLDYYSIRSAFESIGENWQN